MSTIDVKQLVQVKDRTITKDEAYELCLHHDPYVVFGILDDGYEYQTSYKISRTLTPCEFEAELVRIDKERANIMVLESAFNGCWGNGADRVPNHRPCHKHELEYAIRNKRITCDEKSLYFCDNPIFPHKVGSPQALFKYPISLTCTPRELVVQWAHAYSAFAKL